jgi:hypothetical protein
VPLKISSALLLLDPSMYSEKKRSVGVAAALETETTSDSAAIRVMKPTSRRFRRELRKGTLMSLRFDTDDSAIQVRPLEGDKAVYDSDTVSACGPISSRRSAAR